MCASSRAAISWCKKLYDHDRCYIFQNGDGRIIFAIPYEGDFTLIGTTDRDYDGDPGASGRQRGRDRYLCARGERIFRQAGEPRGHRLDLFGRAPAL
jgi:glycerol-3-phosphate dehydrogenase